MKIKLFKLLISVAVLVAVPKIGAIAQETPPSEPHVYPEDFVADYLEDCRQLAMAEDLTAQEADTLCLCTIERFQAEYSFEEYQQLDQETKEEIGYDCFDEILYED